MNIDEQEIMPEKDVTLICRTCAPVFCHRRLSIINKAITCYYLKLMQREEYMLRSRHTSYGLLTLEEGSGGYVIKLNGSLYRGPYGNLNDAIRDFDSLPN